MKLLDKFLTSSKQGFSIGAVLAGLIGSAALERIVNPIVKYIIEIIPLSDNLKPIFNFFIKYFNSILIFGLIISIIILFNKLDFKNFKLKMQDIVGDDLKSVIFYNKYSNAAFLFVIAKYNAPQKLDRKIAA